MSGTSSSIHVEPRAGSILHPPTTEDRRQNADVDSLVRPKTAQTPSSYPVQASEGAYVSQAGRTQIAEPDWRCNGIAHGDLDLWIAPSRVQRKTPTNGARSASHPTGTTVASQV